MTHATSKDIILYETPSGLMLKVTDYQRGFWAEAPLNLEEIRDLTAFLVKTLLSQQDHDYLTELAANILKEMGYEKEEPNRVQPKKPSEGGK